MADDIKNFVKNASNRELEERLEKVASTENRLARVVRTHREMIIAGATLTAEVGGSFAGGAIVGYMQAKDLEEWIALVTAVAGGIGLMKCLEAPNNPYFRALFSTSLGMGAALTAGYVRDYMGNGSAQPMT